MSEREKQQRIIELRKECRSLRARLRHLEAIQASRVWRQRCARRERGTYAS